MPQHAPPRPLRRAAGVSPRPASRRYLVRTMPEFEPAYLRDLGRRIFEAAGTPTDIAEHVANHLVDSNLAGHDSHGVIRIPWYVTQVQDGSVRPAARPRIVEDRPAAAL